MAAPEPACPKTRHRMQRCGVITPWQYHLQAQLGAANKELRRVRKQLPAWAAAAMAVVAALYRRHGRQSWFQ